MLYGTTSKYYFQNNCEIMKLCFENKISQLKLKLCFQF